MQRIIAIAIVAANGVLGDGHDQPFKFKEDWARYKRVTMGHPMIMGRRTHDALGRFLPGRTTIVVTRHPDTLALDGLPADTRALTASSVDEAIDRALQLDDTVYVAGGGEVYRQAWPRITHLDLTEVPQDAEGDVRFPTIGPDWREIERTPRPEFAFVTYERDQSVD